MLILFNDAVRTANTINRQMWSMKKIVLEGESLNPIRKFTPYFKMQVI